jgi:2-oxoglutarate ferredoxin oxidoreductase subunit gamma
MDTKKGATRILVAGFGGQGVLFVGKLLAYIGSMRGEQVTWLPSYGPEMRGGTANCGVILSGSPIGSPIVAEPDVLIAMNLPSFQAYEHKVAPGGAILLDETLVPEKPARSDIGYYPVPATALAQENGLEGLSNMILLGKLFEHRLPTDDTTVYEALKKILPEQKKHLLDANRRAVALGRAYQTAGAERKAAGA